MIQLAIILLTLTSAFCDDAVKPVYKYRYETEDVMQTAETSIPVHGYHVVEGGYYPSEIVDGGVKNGFIGGGGGGYGGHYLGGYGSGFGHSEIGLGGGGLGYEGGIGHIGGGIGQGGFGGGSLGGFGGFGGEAIENSAFSGGKKNLEGEQFEKAFGKKGEGYNQGEQGFSKGEVVAKDVKGDSGYYNGQEGGKKLFEEGKEYHGGQHFNKEGKNEAEKTHKQGHKKGHKIKGFKTSHHKDETGKTEEFYDEAHDEGGNYAFDGQIGSFGEKAGSAFKGGLQEGKYNSGEAKKEGFYENKYLKDNAKANEGKYGENNYAQKGQTYALKKGVDEQSLLGHQESSKLYQHHPFIVPFHHYR